MILDFWLLICYPFGMEIDDSLPCANRPSRLHGTRENARFLIDSPPIKIAPKSGIFNKSLDSNRRKRGIF